MKITSENEFLKDLIKNADKNGEVDMYKYTNPDVISPYDLHDFVENLSAKGYVKYVDTEHYRITAPGKNAYVPLWKNVVKSIMSGAKITLRELISFALGVLATVLAEIILKWLGFQ